MRSKKYFIAIDFDFTITTNDSITRAWGDKLARKLDHLTNTYPVELFILSVANMSYILQKVLVSGSSELLKFFLHVPLVTSEEEDVTRIDHKREENMKNRKEMIKKITHTDNFKDVEYIIAHKKTNYLLLKSKLENTIHSHIFFLDDNRDYPFRFLLWIQCLFG